MVIRVGTKRRWCISCESTDNHARPPWNTAPHTSYNAEKVKLSASSALVRIEAPAAPL
jgi:hypothetical protein